MGFLSALFGKKNETAPQQESSESSASDNYEMFRTLYGDYKVAKGYINKAEAGQQFLDYCATIDKHEIDRKSAQNLEQGKTKIIVAFMAIFLHHKAPMMQSLKASSTATA